MQKAYLSQVYRSMLGQPEGSSFTVVIQGPQ